MFGFYGSFSCKELGSFQAYMTNTDGLVLIRRKTGNPVVVSPDSPDEFTKAVHDVLRRIAKEPQNAE